MFDSPPDPPEPEDNPEEYASYLRRSVVAIARRYLVEHGHEELATVALFSHSHPTMEDLAKAIQDLDEWKREFSLTGID